MGKKKAKKVKRPVATTKQEKTTEQQIALFQKEWFKWVLAILVIIISTIYIYQEPIFEKKAMSLADVKSQSVPFGHFQKEFEKKYDEPALWIPYIFGGMPYHASGSYRIRYTIESTYKVVPQFLRKLFNGSFGINLIFGGIFMLILMRSFGIGITGSLLAAIAFIFTTKVIGTAHTNRITTFMHIPLIFYAVKEIWKQPRWWLVVVFGGAVGSQIGSYHPQVSHLTVIFIMLYLLYSIVIDFREKKDWQGIIKKSAYLTAGLLIAIALAAIVIIPLAEYSPYSIRGAKTALSTGGGGLSAGYATMWSFSWTEIMTLFIPSYVGFGHQTYWGQMPFSGFPNYLGVSILVLGLLYVIIARKDRYRIFWIGGFIIILLISMGKNFAILSDLMLNYFPFYNKFREPSMILILNSLIGAITAGLFVYYLKQISEEDKVKLGKWLFRFAIFFGILLVSFALFSDFLKSFYFEVYQNADKEMKRFTQYSFQQLQPLYEQRFKMLSTDVFRISAIALTILGLIWAYINNKLSYRAVSILLVGLVLIDLVVPGRESVKREFSARDQARSSYEQGNPVADWLNQKEKMSTYRILPVEGFGGNEYVYYGIASVGGYHAVKMANYQAFLDEVTFNNRLLLNMLSTKYIISTRQFGLPGTELAATVGGNNIYLNKEYVPYARFVSEIIIENNREKTIAAIKGQRFDVGETAYVEFDGAPPLTEFETDSSRTIVFMDKNPQLMKLLYKNKYDGFMVISEMHYPPGWRAYIDDEPVDIHYVNTALMGIFIPAGQHNLLLKYEQPSFYMARTISQVSFWGILLILIGLAGNVLYGQWKKREDEAK